MATANLPDLPPHYLADETAWLDAMAGLVRAGRLDLIDSANLAEFLESRAERDRREVGSRLTTLLTHLLKWHFQPDRRSRSWLRTVEIQRQELERCFKAATLRAHAETVLSKEYRRAIRRATVETGLPESTFPAKCPYTLDSAMTDPFGDDFA